MAYVIYVWTVGGVDIHKLLPYEAHLKVRGASSRVLECFGWKKDGETERDSKRDRERQQERLIETERETERRETERETGKVTANGKRERERGRGKRDN